VAIKSTRGEWINGAFELVVLWGVLQDECISEVSFELRVRARKSQFCQQRSSLWETPAALGL
jgi:hypothetical protein